LISIFEAFSFWTNLN
jgi:hypothetical protein